MYAQFKKKSPFDFELPQDPKIGGYAIVCDNVSDVSLGLLCDNRAQDMGGTNLYFREEMRTKKGEDLRIINDGSEKTGDGLNLYESRITESGRATVSST
jgi:hypothetical protein